MASVHHAHIPAAFAKPEALPPPPSPERVSRAGARNVRGNQKKHMNTTSAHRLKPVLTAVLLGSCAALLSAQVTMTFDSDAAGFADENGTAVHSTQGGGSVQFTSNDNWDNNTAAFSITSDAAFHAEFLDAVANDGTLSFDVTIYASDYDPTDAPSYFEIVINPNTEMDGFGGNLLLASNFDFSTLQADGSQTRTISAKISEFSSYANLATSSYGNIHIGTNCQNTIIGNGGTAGDDMDNVNIYIDNLTVDGTKPPAGVTLTFDSDEEGFVNLGDPNTVVIHATENGGSLEIWIDFATIGNGWVGNAAQLSLDAGTPIRAEYEKALANGGVMEFDLIVYESFQTFVDPGVDSSPNWFEPLVIANSADSWDGNVAADTRMKIQGHEWPLNPDPRMLHVSMEISGATKADNDDILYGNPASPWHQIRIGLNVESAVMAEGTIFIDNFKIAANEATSAPVLQVTAVGTSSVDLSWTDDVTDATYAVERSTTGDNDWADIDTGISGLTYTDNALPASDVVLYRVRRE